MQLVIEKIDVSFICHIVSNKKKMRYEREKKWPKIKFSQPKKCLQFKFEEGREQGEGL